MFGFFGRFQRDSSGSHQSGGNVGAALVKQISSIVKPFRKKKGRKHGNNPDFMRIIAQATQKDRKEQDNNEEANIRVKLLNSFLQTSHGELTQFSRLHLDALEKDPIFYGHLSRWYFEKGSVRDHRELFVAHLLTSPYPEHRSCGIVLIQFLRVYQVERVIRYVREVLHYPTRSLKTAVRLYLQRRENQKEWFDESVIRNKHSLKKIYASLHIKPGERAERILFRNDPPSDSRVYALKLLQKNRNNPDIQARLILENHIHFTTAMGYIKIFTPSVLFALLSMMTPQQVINNMEFLRKRGAMNSITMRKVIEEKLKHGVNESRVNDFKTLAALSRFRADEDMAGKLLEMTNDRLRKKGRITVPTAIFVDKSGSMDSCIEIGKLLATMCSSISDSDLYVYAFDSFYFEVKNDGGGFQSWMNAFKRIRATGATAIGAPFKDLMDKREVEQILVISDGEENCKPYFAEMLEKYESWTGKECRVIFLKVSEKQTPLETSMKGREMTVIPFNGDYYSLPNVIPLLCSAGNFELVNEIMSRPLYERTDINSLPPGFDERTFEVL